MQFYDELLMDSVFLNMTEDNTNVTEFVLHDIVAKVIVKPKPLGFMAMIGHWTKTTELPL